MIRSFGVRSHKQALVGDLARELDRKLVALQEDGWKIISIVNTPCKEWEACKGYFDSVLFTIIAEHK